LTEITKNNHPVFRNKAKSDIRKPL